MVHAGRFAKSSEYIGSRLMVCKPGGIACWVTPRGHQTNIIILDLMVLGPSGLGKPGGGILPGY